MRKKLLFSFAIVLSLIAFGWWWWAHFDYVVRPVDVGFERSAFTNRFLAASRFLKAQGFEVMSEAQFKTVNQLLDSDAIVLSTEQQHMSRKQVIELLNWVAAGGYLIVGAHEDQGHLAKLVGFKRVRDWSESQCQMPVSEKENDLSDGGTGHDSHDRDAEDSEKLSWSEQLKRENETHKANWLAKQEAQQHADDEQAHQAKAWRQLVYPWEEDWETAGEAYITPIHFAHSEQTNYLDFASVYTLVHDPLADLAEDFPVASTLRYTAGDDSQNTFLSFEIGDGQVDVLVNTDIWQNDFIGVLDHAHVLKQLLLAPNMHSPILKVSLVTALEAPSIFQYMAKWAPELVVALLLLFVAWLLMRGYRIGPIHEVFELQRRSLLEHVSACGLYLWYGGGREALLKALLAPVLAQAAKRSGRAIVSGQQDHWVRFLAIIEHQAPQLCSGVGVQRLKRVFYIQSDERLTEQEFIETVNLLQQLGKVL